MIAVTRRGVRFAATLCVAVAMAFAPAVQAAMAVPAAVVHAQRAAGLDGDRLAYVVMPVDARDIVHALAPDRPMPPASTMKLVTSAAALDLLGPNHRRSTELRVTGKQRGDVLHGDVILRGRADPDLDTPALWQLLQGLRDAGVRLIAGQWVIDRSFFSPARIDQGLPPFDEAPEWQYNVIPDALPLDGGVIHLRLAAADAKVSAQVEPPLPGLVVRSAMRPIDAPCKDWDETWQPPTVRVDSGGRRVRVDLHGEFPRGCSAVAELQLVDRDLHLAMRLRQLWTGMGGHFDGGRGGTVVSGRAPASSRLVAEHVSRPLAEVLRHMNKASDNPQTRQLFLAIGAYADDIARGPWLTTQAAASERVTQWLAAQGIDTHGLVLDNGSGLSRSERVTPRQMAAMLHAAWHKPWAPELISSLPLVGVDGTMRNRLRNSPAAAHARIKTGTLRDVDAVAGYVQDVTGRWWVLAAMQGHGPAQRARPVLDALIDWVARGQPADE